MGMVGLESAVLVVQAAVVETGLTGWPEVERAMSRRPAEIAGLTDAARPVAEGRVADLVLLDPSARRTFGVADLAGRSTNSPYLGQELPGRVVATVFRGTPTVLDGRVREPEEVAAGWT
jgi:dihydroorotase